MTGLLRATLPMLALAVAAAPLTGMQRGDRDDWCDRSGRGDREVSCEVRELTMDAVGSLSVDGGQNGGVSVFGERRSDILVEARVITRARSMSRAEALADEIRISTDGSEVGARGPNSGRRESWSVSFRIYVPTDTDLSIETHNGGIGIQGVDARVRFDAVNGGVHLSEMAGDVRGETRNGGLSVELAGREWDGAGLDVSTRNGGINLLIPRGYSADLETGTVNGGIELDFPVTVTGRISRHLRTQLGSGGAPIRVMTRNGGVHVRQGS